MFWANSKGKNEKNGILKLYNSLYTTHKLYYRYESKYVQWPEICTAAPRSLTTLSLWNIRDAHAMAYLSFAADQRGMENINYIYQRLFHLL